MSSSPRINGDEEEATTHDTTQETTSPSALTTHKEISGLDRNIQLFLYGLDLEQYYVNFIQHAIDFELFLTLTNDDLKNIGITNDDHRRALLRGATGTKSLLPDESSRPMTKEEADAILSNSYKYLNVLKLYLKEVDPNRAKREIKNTALDTENSASTGIITFSNAAIDCVRDLRKQYNSLLPNDLPKTKRKTKSFWNVPVATILLTGVLISGVIIRKLNRPP